MPKIQWTNLPPALPDHLFERLRERKITAEDLYQLEVWRESEPEAPEGLGGKQGQGNSEGSVDVLDLGGGQAPNAGSKTPLVNGPKSVTESASRLPSIFRRASAG